MNREKWFSALWGFVLAFLISSASVLCVVSGYGMAVEPSQVLLWCGITALGSAVCFTLPLGWLPFAAVAAGGVCAWLFGGMEMSFRAFLFRITRKCSGVWGIPVIRPLHYTADMLEPLIGSFVCLLGAVIALLIAWAICRKKPALPGVLLAILVVGLSVMVRETAPARIWVWLLLFGILLVLLTHRVRRVDGAQGNRLATMTVLPLALVLLLLFGATPQSRYRADVFARNTAYAVLENRFVKAIFGDLTGKYFEPANNNVIRLDNVGSKTAGQEEILRVEADFTGRLYLRNRTLDTYDGLTWSNSGASNPELYWPDQKNLQSAGEIRITTRFAHKMLYLPYYVPTVNMTEASLGMENTEKLTDYTFSVAVLPTELVGTNTNATISNPAQYRHYPKSVAKWAESMVSDITAGKSGVYAKAQAIANYVRSCARYDLQTDTMPYGKSDFAKWFLKEADTGYCVHFATSATVLLQAAGIPARYVSGYAPQVQAGEVTVVRSSDAHAWVEYWLPGVGWTTLEVTPAADAQPPLAAATENQINWNTVALVLTILFSATILGVLVCRSIRICLRRRKMQKGELKSRILAYWQEAARFAACLQEKPDENLRKIAEKAKFSQHPPQEEDLELFVAYLKDAKKRIRSHSFFRKLYYRFVLALY